MSINCEFVEKEASPARIDRWQDVVEVLTEHYINPEIGAAPILCAALASHALKQFPPAWSLETPKSQLMGWSAAELSKL